MWLVISSVIDKIELKRVNARRCLVFRVEKIICNMYIDCFHMARQPRWWSTNKEIPGIELNIYANIAFFQLTSMANGHVSKRPIQMTWEGRHNHGDIVGVFRLFLIGQKVRKFLARTGQIYEDFSARVALLRAGAGKDLSSNSKCFKLKFSFAFLNCFCTYLLTWWPWMAVQTHRGLVYSQSIWLQLPSRHFYPQADPAQYQAKCWTKGMQTN